MQQLYNQMYTPPKSGGKIAFLEGLKFGLILGVIALIIQVISAFVSNPARYQILANIPILLLGILVFLLSLGTYFLTGIVASKQTGKVSTGNIAGLWAGAFYATLSAIVGLVLFFTVTLPKTVAALDPALSPNVLITGTVMGVIFGILFAIGLGAGMGALGGLLGKSMSRGASASAYPNYPYTQYPPQQYLPQQYPPQQYLPQQYPPQQYLPQQYPPQQQYPGQPYAPQPKSDPYPPYSNPYGRPPY